MKLKSSFLAAAALSALAVTSYAQMASDATPMVPGTTPGTMPGFVRVDPATVPSASMDNGMMRQTPGTNMAPGASMMQPGMTPQNGMMMQNGTMMSAQDQLFCARAAEGNLAEITFAQLALDKSKNSNVRQTANVILQGHTKAQNDLMQLMRAKGMMMTPMLSATHMVVYDALKKAKGDNFDKMYMAGQTGDHENTIALFSTQVNAGMNDALKGYANQYLPDIVGHTILIYNVARQVKAPGSEVRPMLPPVPPGVTPALMGTPINMTDYSTITRSMNDMMMQMAMPRM